jgi:hypothetical protein
MDFGTLVSFITKTSVRDKPLHPAYIFGPCATPRRRMMEMHEAGSHSALDLDGAGRRLVPLPGVRIFGPPGSDRAKVRIFSIQQITTSERSRKARVRKTFGG